MTCFLFAPQSSPTTRRDHVKRPPGSTRALRPMSKRPDSRNAARGSVIGFVFAAKGIYTSICAENHHKQHFNQQICISCQGNQGVIYGTNLFVTLWQLWRVGRLPWGGRGAGVRSQSSQRGVLGCQSQPKVVQIWTISCFPIRISESNGLTFLS